MTGLSNEQRGMDAEARALTLANLAGLRPSKVMPDVHGFDYYVQLPASSSDDSLFGGTSALVQVKGTTLDRVSVDLTVWKNLIETPLPSFFLVYAYPEIAAREPSRAFLVHVHGGLLEGAVERLWKARGEALTGRTMDLTWTQTDELVPTTDDVLVARLRAAVGDPAEYVRNKLAARDTAGRDDAPVRLLMRRTGASVDQEMAEFAVGLRDELPVDRMEAFETRFGLERPVPERSAIDGAVMGWPNGEPPTEPCEVIFIDKTTGEDIRLSARLAISTRVFPWLRGPNAQIRVIHDVVDFVLHPGTPRVTVSIRVPDQLAELRQVAIAARVLGLLEAGGCDLELRVRGLPPHRVTLSGEATTTGLPAEQRDVLEAGTLAFDIVRRLGLPEDLSLSHAALARSVTVFRRTALFLRHAAGEIAYSTDIEPREPGAILALLLVNWVMLGSELIALHGVLVGPATNDSPQKRVRVERATGRLLVARRVPLPLAEGDDGFVEEAIAKITADPTISALIGPDLARAAWNDTRTKILTATAARTDRKS